MLYGASCCAYDDQRITSRTFFKPASPIFLKYSGFMGGSGTVSPLRSNTPGMLMPRPSLRFCSKGSVPGAADVNRDFYFRLPGPIRSTPSRHPATHRSEEHTSELQSL